MDGMAGEDFVFSFRLEELKRLNSRRVRGKYEIGSYMICCFFCGKKTWMCIYAKGERGANKFLGRAIYIIVKNKPKMVIV